MTADSQSIADAFLALLAERARNGLPDAGSAGWNAGLWEAVHAGGFAAVAVSEEAGGSGATLEDLAAILKVAGRQAAPIPLAEANAAALVLAQCGRAADARVRTVVPDVERHAVECDAGDAGLRVRGRLQRVPWAVHCEEIVLLARFAPEPDAAHEPWIGTASVVECGLAPGVDIADQPLADLTLPPDGIVMRPLPSASYAGLAGLLPLARLPQMVGAMARVLELSVAYAGQRQQFGRPLTAFQAVGHLLARLGSAVAQADAIVALAVRRAAAGQGGGPELLAARLCVSNAARVAIEVGHQVHGAIGVTIDYELQRHTRRLMAWREAGGSEMLTARELGRMVERAGADGLWGLIAAESLQ